MIWCVLQKQNLPSANLQQTGVKHKITVLLIITNLVFEWVVISQMCWYLDGSTFVWGEAPIYPTWPLVTPRGLLGSCVIV